MGLAQLLQYYVLNFPLKRNTYNYGQIRHICFLIFATTFYSTSTFAQLSPGELAEAHKHLEGLSNCTQCHVLGEKVSNDKCLACHTILKERIDSRKGYHVSPQIEGKECISCHSDHHGRKFQMIRFEKEKFDHSLTGYVLEGAHQERDCEDCHKKDFISNPELKKRTATYLGLTADCLSCHTDPHQETLSSDCMQCHDFKAFKPASKFDHDRAKYKLEGKHKEVACTQCHPINKANEKPFQQFTGIPFSSCTDCHTDVHQNKFGQQCTQCHTVASFSVIKGLSGFDHNRTRFKLEDKHRNLDCKACHKAKLTDPLQHQRCTDCHEDYHWGEFVRKEHNPDCSDCHTT